MWPRSFSVTDSLESSSATHAFGKVAPMGVPVIVVALLISGIVVVAFLLAIWLFNSNSIRLLRSSVTSVVVAMAALVSNVMSSVVVDALLVWPFFVAATASIDLFFVATAVMSSVVVDAILVWSFVVAGTAAMDPFFVAAASSVSSPEIAVTVRVNKY